MKRNNNNIGKRGRFSAFVIVLALLVSAVPVGFFMVVLPVGAEQTGESSSGSENSNDSETTSGTGSTSDTGGRHRILYHLRTHLYKRSGKQ